MSKSAIIPAAMCGILGALGAIAVSDPDRIFATAHTARLAASDALIGVGQWVYPAPPDVLAEAQIIISTDNGDPNYLLLNADQFQSIIDSHCQRSRV